MVSNDNIGLKYSLLKNLGWVRLRQKRYEEAAFFLKSAIDLLENSNSEKIGSAYCLLAELQEELKNSLSALKQWENCLRYTDHYLPEEDQWIGIAQEKIKIQLTK